MRVKRVGYVGMRTREVEGMTRFFRDVLGLEAAGEDETVTSRGFRRTDATSSRSTPRIIETRG